MRGSSASACSVDDLCEVLSSGGVEEGASAQLVVLRDGARHEVLLDVGPGESTSSLHHLWCATRPVIALGALLFCEREGVDPQAPLGSLGSPWSHVRLGTTSLVELLAHRAPLVQPSLLEAQMIPASGLAVEAERAARKGVKGLVGFSEFTAWKLLDLWFERRGIQLSRFLEDEVIAPMGLGDQILFDIDEVRLASLTERLLPQRLTSGKRSYHTRVLSFASHERVAFGGYVSAEGLVRFVVNLGEALRGREVPGLPSPGFLAPLFEARPARSWDAKLERDCSFWAGCMVGLDDHGFPGWGQRAVGALGWQGRSFAVADPDQNVAFALVVDGPLDRSNGFALRKGVTELVRG